MVLEVIDGDTVRLRMDATSEELTVRLLAIDAPETRPAQCGGPESTENLRGLTGTSIAGFPPPLPSSPGKHVRLVTDDTQDVKDAFGGRWLIDHRMRAPI